MRQLRPDHVEKGRFGHADVAQSGLESLPIELAIGAAERWRCEHGLPNRCVRRHDAQPLYLQIDRGRGNQLLQRLARHGATHLRRRFLALRQVARGLRHVPLIGLLQLLTLDGDAADLGDPGG